MSRRTDIVDLLALGLSPGEARALDLHVGVEPFELGGGSYVVEPELVPARLDVSRTIGGGWALRLRLAVRLRGPCMRCLEQAAPGFAVDAREIEQPGGGDELSSPYVEDGGELDLAAWARDAVALTLPAQLVCRPDCAGLCARCGADLNEDPAHRHDQEPDPRWAKLSEIRFD